MRQRESLVDVIGVLLRRRRLILLVTGAAAVLSIIISLVLPVYYEAGTTFLAASPDQTNPSKIFNEDTGLDDYGTGDDIERLIGVATSEETIRYLIDSFDLYNVYDIDRASPKAAYQVREAFRDVYNVVRTRYDAVEITVEDKDPERAAAMANAARTRTASVIRGIIGQGRANLASMYGESIAEKQRQRAYVADSLQRLSTRYGIVDVKAQGEGLSSVLGITERNLAGDSARLAYFKAASPRGYLRDSIAKVESRIAGGLSTRSSVLKQLKVFSEGASQVSMLQTESETIDEQLAEDRERLRQINTAGDFGGAVIYVLDSAYVPTNKSRPVRWLIVVGCTLFAFVLITLGVVVHTTYKEVEWRQYLRA